MADPGGSVSELVVAGGRQPLDLALPVQLPEVDGCPETRQRPCRVGTGAVVEQAEAQPRRELRLKLAALCEPELDSPGLEVV